MSATKYMANLVILNPNEEARQLVVDPKEEAVAPHFAYPTIGGERPARQAFRAPED